MVRLRMIPLHASLSSLCVSAVIDFEPRSDWSWANESLCVFRCYVAAVGFDELSYYGAVYFSKASEK